MYDLHDYYISIERGGTDFTFNVLFSGAVSPMGLKSPGLEPRAFWDPALQGGLVLLIKRNNDLGSQIVSSMRNIQITHPDISLSSAGLGVGLVIMNKYILLYNYC